MAVVFVGPQGLQGLYTVRLAMNGTPLPTGLSLLSRRRRPSPDRLPQQTNFLVGRKSRRGKRERRQTHELHTLNGDLHALALQQRGSALRLVQRDAPP